MARKSPTLSQLLDTLNTALERAIDSVDAALALCDASNARIDALNNPESTRIAHSDHLAATAVACVRRNLIA